MNRNRLLYAIKTCISVLRRALTDGDWFLAHHAVDAIEHLHKQVYRQFEPEESASAEVAFMRAMHDFSLSEESDTEAIRTVWGTIEVKRRES